MPKANSNASVTFSDGAVKESKWVVIAAQLDALADEEAEFTRIFSYDDGEWGATDLDDISIRSMCNAPPPERATYYLSRDGRVVVATPNGLRNESIPDVGADEDQLGYVTRIKVIGKTIFVCGVAGQVYRRQGGKWIHFDDGVLDRRGQPEALTFYGIDGSSESDIYAVGEKGLVCHHNGKSWNHLSRVTKETLEAVRCVSPTEVYICGKNGTFLKGSKTRWENYSLDNAKIHFRSVEVFHGKPYLASAKGLYEFDGTKLVRTETQLRPPIDGRRLQAGEGVLWSFGSKHLAFFDGKKWTYVPHPDNE